MPWSAEELQDAVNVLWTASEQGPIIKIQDGEEAYLMANEVSYTDELYLDALKVLEEEKKLESFDEEGNRKSFRRSDA